MFYQIPESASLPEKPSQLAVIAAAIQQLSRTKPVSIDELEKHLTGKLKTKQPIGRVIRFYGSELKEYKVDVGAAEAPKLEPTGEKTTIEIKVDGQPLTSRVDRLFKLVNLKDVYVAICGAEFNEHDVWLIGGPDNNAELIGVFTPKVYDRMMKSRIMSVNVTSENFEWSGPSLTVKRLAAKLHPNNLGKLALTSVEGSSWGADDDEEDEVPNE